MQDVETETLWSQVTGIAIMGPMEGTTLTLFPSSMTTFSEYSKLYPGGVLLAKPDKGGAGSPYNDYFADPKKLGIFGRVDNFERLPGKANVYGLRIDNREVAVAQTKLAKDGWALVDAVEGSVLVTYDTKSGTVAAFEIIDGTAVSDGVIRNEKTNQSWHLLTGVPEEEGGENLEPVPILSAYWFAWVSFFPNTELIQ